MANTEVIAPTIPVNVVSGTINIGTVAAVVSVALDGSGAGDTVGVVDAAGDRLQINSDGSINVVSGAGSGDGALLDGATSSIKATVKDYVNSNPLMVALSDSNGDQITTLPVSLASVPAHNVTVTNAAGASAVNIQDGGNTITVDGTVIANAGTGPWPVTDNGGSLTVDGPLTDTQLRATPVPVSGSFSASTAADVLAPDGDPGYTVGDLAKNLTQTDDGRLRVAVAGLVSDARQTFTDGTLQSLSMTNDGLLRVSAIPPRYSVPFFAETEEHMWGSHQTNYTFTGSPWGEW